MVHCGEITVRGYHLDFFGHVNNARYLEFMEEARWRLSEGNLDLTQILKQGTVLAVVNININYRKPAVLGDKLELFLGLAGTGNKSMTLYQEIRFRDTDTVVADAKVTFVLADAETGKSIEMDEDLKKQFEKLNDA